MGIRVYLLFSRARNLEWCLRTSFSVAIATFLCLYRPSRNFLTYGGDHMAGLNFIMFITVVVKDSTLGATILNGWVSMIGVLVASFFCWWTTLGMGEVFTFEYNILIMFILAFIVQYVEFHVLGKKIALSILALTFLKGDAENPSDVWRFCFDVLIGIGCALIGNLLPWPKLACDEVDTISRFLSKNISALFDSVLEDFLNLNQHNDTIQFHGNNIDSTMQGLNILQSQPNPLWKNEKQVDIKQSLPSLSHTLAQQQQQQQQQQQLSSQTGRRASTLSYHQTAIKTINKRYMRHELISRLEETLLDFQARSVESRFGTSRYRAVHRYANFANLCRKLLLIMEALELRVEKISNGDLSSLQLLLAMPNFSSSILAVSQTFKKVMMALSTWLGETSTTPNPALFTSISQLKSSLITLDDIYTKYRNESIQSIHPTFTDTAEEENIDKSKSRWSTNEEASPDFFLNLNTLLFLVDSIDKLIQEHAPKPSPPSSSSSVIDVIITSPQNGTNSSHSTVIWQKVTYYLNELRLLMLDLIPAQRHLFSCCCSCSRDRGLILPPAVAMRLRQASSVSVSMVLAGLYSYICDANDPTFAAFTVSYIAGGAMAGASIITSFNRAVGTVVACVFCLLISKLINSWELYDFDWFVGIVIALSQFPSTYIRSIPKYGYAGTVFGFTVPILLVSFRTFSNDIVLQRIVDTVVAVIIFVLVELLFLGRHYSEDLLLDDTLKIVKGIDSHFHDFTDIFKTYQDDPQSHDKSSKNQSKLSIKDLRAPTFLTDIRRQRELSSYVALELTMLRPKPFREQLMQELLNNEEQVHKCIELMSWIVRACHIHQSTLLAATTTSTATTTIAAIEGDDGQGKGEDEHYSSNSHHTDGKQKKQEDQHKVSANFFLSPLEQEISIVGTLIKRTCSQLSEGIVKMKNVTIPPLTRQSESRRASQDILHTAYTSSQLSPYFDFTEVSELATQSIDEEAELLEHFSSLSYQLQLAYKESYLSRRFSTITATMDVATLGTDDDSMIIAESSVDNLVGGSEDNNSNNNLNTCQQHEKRTSTSYDILLSNPELKILNAAFSSLSDLLDAMSALARTIARMQAYRAVQLTESKYINFAVETEKLFKLSK